MTHIPSTRLQRLARQLTRLRLRSRLSQEAAARGASINRATLSKIENALACPRESTLRRLLSLYGVTDSARIARLMALRSTAANRTTA